jgi:hypothetical protein
MAIGECQLIVVVLAALYRIVIAMAVDVQI